MACLLRSSPPSKERCCEGLGQAHGLGYVSAVGAVLACVPRCVPLSRGARSILRVETVKRLQSERRRSGTGTRVTLYGPDGPTVSLWAEGNGRGLYEWAVELEQATPEPIDAILQAAMWRGKKAQA